MFVLDTTAVSALMRSEPSHTRRLLELRPIDVAIPQPALAEIRYGLQRLGKNKRRQLLEQKLGLLLASISRCAWTDQVSEQFAELKAQLERAGQRLDDVDLMIAAHALILDASLVSRNVRHFSRIKALAVVDWEAP